MIEQKQLERYASGINQQISEQNERKKILIEQIFSELNQEASALKDSIDNFMKKASQNGATNMGIVFDIDKIY